jgi:hypothetical protein
MFIYHIEPPHLLEINRNNPLGMKGAMAEEFAALIKNLWNGKYNWTNANRLRVFKFIYFTIKKNIYISGICRSKTSRICW